MSKAGLLRLQFMIEDTIAAKRKANEELKICTGCGHRSDVKISAGFLACCPDNNYVPLDDYLKHSVYRKGGRP